MVDILLWLAFIVSIAVGSTVYSRRPSDLTHQSFLGISIAGSIWILTNVMFLNTVGTLQYASILFSYASIGFFAMFFVLFSQSLASSKKPPNRTMICLGIAVSLLAATPDILAVAVVNNAIVTTPLLWLYALYLLVYYSWGITILLGGMNRGNMRVRRQIHAVLTGIVITFVGAGICNLILPIIGNYRYVTLGPIFSLVFMVFFAYSIIRHHLFDIKFAAVRTFAYTLSLAALAAIHYLFAYVLSVIIFEDNSAYGISMSPVNIILALVLAFVFQPVKRFFDKITDKIFFRDRYDTDEFYSRLSELLATSFDLKDLLQHASREIGTTLKAEQTMFYVRYNRCSVEVGAEGHTHLDADEWFKIDDRFPTGHSVLVAETVEAERGRGIKGLMVKHNLAVLMRLAHDNQTLGYLALGEQRTGGYTNRDIKVLETIADELVIAIQNALSIQEVRDLNVNLQARINEATKELRHTNIKLTKLDETKDEFISMASHQLRTPLTSVKGYISMVLDGDAGDISKQQRELLEQAFESSQRMVFLIGDFLNISRLRTGKFVLEPSSVNLSQIVREEIAQLSDVARSRGIGLVFEADETLPSITADENKLRQVMMNFMDNAIYYTMSGGSIRVQLYKSSGFVVFRVIDDGIGVPKAEQAHLFTKFFRAPNARKQRPDGTGIGLYMAKKVVVAHGGVILFESKEGKGSTFGFKLPLVIDPRRFDKPDEPDE